MAEVQGPRAERQLEVELLDPTALVRDRWLNKASRDMLAFEFMEGTSDIHRLSMFQDVLKELTL